MTTWLDVNDHVKLCYLKNIIEKTYNKKYIKKFQKILDSGFDVNYAVPRNSEYSSISYSHEVGDTALHFAAIRCEEGIISMLLIGGADFTIKNEDGFTPLRKLCEKKLFCFDDTSEMELLLEAHCLNGSVENPHSDDGISHFHIACMLRKSRFIEYFLSVAVPINEPIKDTSNVYPGCIPLHIAMNEIEPTSVQILLENGADLNYLNSRGLSPLHVLIEGNERINNLRSTSDRDLNKAKTTCLLIENELDIILERRNIYLSPVDEIGLTVLHVYCTKRNGSEKFEKDMKEFINELPNRAAINAPVKWDSMKWPGFTPLHFASIFNLKSVLMLLDKGANLLAKDAKGVTPLDLCVRNFKAIEVASILEAQKTFESIRFENGKLVTEVLVAFDNPDEVTNYLKFNDVQSIIPFSSPVWPGFTLFHLAVLFTKTDALRLCLFMYDNDADSLKLVQDANKMTALHLFFYTVKNSVENFFLICNNYNDEKVVNLIDKNGLSHFHIACIAYPYNSNTKIYLNKFLNSGVDVNMRLKTTLKLCEQTFLHLSTGIEYKVGTTGLHIAARQWDEELAQVLLNHKANPHLLDEGHRTWVHLTFQNCHQFNQVLEQVLVISPFNIVSPGGLSYFHLVCYLGNLAPIQALRHLVPDINEPLTKEEDSTFGKDFIGDTPLILALKSKSSSMKEIIDFLLNFDADPAIKNAAGYNALTVALIESVKKMKSWQQVPMYWSDVIGRLAFELKDKQVFPDEMGLSLLHIACFTDDLELMKDLLESGADVNCRMKPDAPIWPDYTPLHLLINVKKCAWDDEKVQLLVAYAAELRFYTDSSELPKMKIGKDGLSLLHLSCMRDDPDVVEELISAGVDVNKPVDYFAADWPGYSPLHIAAKYGTENVINVLLKHGAKTNVRDSFGYTPIHLLAKYHPKLIKLFPRDDEEVDLNDESLFSYTVKDMLLYSKTTTAQEIIEFLSHVPGLDKISSSFKIRILAKLAHRLSKEDFAFVVDNIPNINVADSKGCNVFHYVVLYPHEDLNLIEFAHNVSLLESHGCDLDCKNNKGKTPLHYAVFECSEINIWVLLHCGADMLVPDKVGRTPNPHRSDYFRKYIILLQAADLYPYPISMRDMQTIEKKKLVLIEMKNVIIINSFTLHHILSKRIMKKKFPALPVTVRRFILDFVDNNLDRKFTEWLPVFKLQLRRAFKRIELIKSAIAILKYILLLPELCLECILINFSNRNLKKICNISDL